MNTKRFLLVLTISQIFACIVLIGLIIFFIVFRAELVKNISLIQLITAFVMTLTLFVLTTYMKKRVRQNVKEKERLQRELRVFMGT